MSIKKIPELNSAELASISKYYGRVPTVIEQEIIKHLWLEFQRYASYREIIDQAGSGVDEVPIIEFSDESGGSSFMAQMRADVPVSELAAVITGGWLELRHRQASVTGGNIAFNRRKETDKLPAPINKLLKAIGSETGVLISQYQTTEPKPENANLFLLGRSLVRKNEAVQFQKGLLGLAGFKDDGKTKKNIDLSLRIIKLSEILSAKPWILGLTPKTKRDLLNDIADYSRALGLGFDGQWSAIEAGRSAVTSSTFMLLIHYQAGFEAATEQIITESGMQFLPLGELVQAIGLTVHSGEKLRAQVPVELYRPDITLIKKMAYAIPSEHETRQVDQGTLLKGQAEFNKQLLDLLGIFRVSGIDYDRLVSTETVMLEDRQYTLYLAQNNNSQREFMEPHLASGILVAEAVRRIACAGGHPKLVSAYLPVSDKPDSAYLSCFNGIAKGIAGTCRNLGLALDKFHLGDPQPVNRCVPLIGVAGFRNSTTDVSLLPFKDEGDFISILGSLRGELGSSVYMHHFYDTTAGNLPSIDFSMERRIREAVIQGIEEGLVKSAVSLGAGGLVTTLARSIGISDEGLGARIHLSRKLLPEELLFGETQGVVIISIDENELMEFERICMNIGVPSTTIGRVTADNRLTFNNLINLPVDDIRSILNN